jgi:hypothetical protein
MSLEEIEKEALKLSPSSRAILAEKLIRSLEGLSDAEIEKLWAEESQRRHEELEAGLAVSRPADQVFRDAKSRFS